MDYTEAFYRIQKHWELESILTVHYTDLEDTGIWLHSGIVRSLERDWLYELELITSQGELFRLAVTVPGVVLVV